MRLLVRKLRTQAHAGRGLRHLVIQFPERWFVLKRFRDINDACCKGCALFQHNR
ncbi:hypothetical protein I3843_09G125500 [Carya illinoinensis]|uniref:Uncharacterized protein n=1 Tax=Carya illinoinensis TaxID=32201 RepID=A0A8T1PPK7_CARIL|nr:hypothetical protein I3760_09G126500 [Carya illinoinensis]KAG6642260.1 hypothetical protein CIPAW_09G130200 [Carya illinoinensis]KAG7963592.1 hypothetical protein I3843_09G125500 [Carya illinoinensis]